MCIVFISIMETKTWVLAIFVICLLACGCSWLFSSGIGRLSVLQVADEPAAVPTFAPPSLSSSSSILIPEPTVVPAFLFSNAQTTRE